MIAPAESEHRQRSEIEIAILGGMMLEAEAADFSLERLRYEDFFFPAHQAIYRAIESLRAQRAAPDPLAVRGELQRLGTFETAGGSAYLAKIVEIVSTAANQPYWTQQLLERASVEAFRRFVEQGFDRERESGGLRAALDWIDRVAGRDESDSTIARIRRGIHARPSHQDTAAA